MINPLQNLLLNVPPREKTGGTIADRYDYQITWALCHMMELHQSGQDYLIVLEFHEDVITLDSVVNPSNIRFYQIKTRNGESWRISDLLRRKEATNGKLPSILGKLYQNKLNFPEHAEKLMFVSNLPVKAKRKTGATSAEDCLRCTDIDGPEFQKMIKSLKEEIGSDPSLETTFLGVSDISLADHETHARGKLSRFLEHRRPNGKFRIGAIYAGLIGELRRRNNFQGALGSIEDLGAKKGFSPGALEALLKTMGVDADYTKAWEQADQRLATEHADIKRVKAIRNRWDFLEAQRTDPENLTLQQLITAVRNAVEGATAERLIDLMEHVVQQVRSDGTVYTADDIRALTLMEYYEPTELPAADQKPPETTS